MNKTTQNPRVQAAFLAAFPIQAAALHPEAPECETATGNRRRAKSREDRIYAKEARLFVKVARKAGLYCPVVQSVKELRESRRYGHPTSAKLNEVHHLFGRLGDLLRWQPGWIALSKAGHRWVHNNPAKARELGFLCEIGDWNKSPSELVRAAAKITHKRSCVHDGIMLL